MDHDGIGWHPRMRIEKYSADQVEWARYHHVELSGEALRAMCPVPECGTVYDTGNGVTKAGLANLAAVLTGGGYPLEPGRSVFGVGSDKTAFDDEQVHLSRALGEEPGRSWYKPMDPGYPNSPAPSVIEGQATFTEAEACFEWLEWCWGTGPGSPAPHHRLLGAYGGKQPVMVNRKASAAGWGVKEPGVAWVFRTQINLRP